MASNFALFQNLKAKRYHRTPLLLIPKFTNNKNWLPIYTHLNIYSRFKDFCNFKTGTKTGNIHLRINNFQHKPIRDLFAKTVNYVNNQLLSVSIQYTKHTILVLSSLLLTYLLCFDLPCFVSLPTRLCLASLICLARSRAYVICASFAF